MPPQAIGGPADPIEGYDGGPLQTGPYFSNGLCVARRGSCVVGLPEAQDSCGLGASCTETGVRGSVCLPDCTPVGNGRPDRCSPGYSCELERRVCLPYACVSDDECRVSRRDGDGDGRIVGAVGGIGASCRGFVTDAGDGTSNDGAAPAPLDGGLDSGTRDPCGAGLRCDALRAVCVPVDPLVYDPNPSIVCDRAARRCVGIGTPGALAGQACTTSRDCELDGICQPQSIDANGTVARPDGLCTKLGCDLPGRACAGGSLCVNRGSPDDPTMQCELPCRFGIEAESDRRGAVRDMDGDGVYETGGHGAGCRPGYRCQPVPGTSSSGCQPGNYNDVSTPNLTEECPAGRHDLCDSPFGAASCLALGDALTMQGARASYCTIVNCNPEYGFPADVCGPDADCNTTLFSDGTGLCLERCTDASSCPTDWGCIAIDPMSSVRHCFPTCMSDTDCRRGKRCLTGIVDNRRYCQ